MKTPSALFSAPARLPTRRKRRRNWNCLTQDDALLCFTSEDTMRVWDSAGRTAVVLPGPVIAQLAAQAEVFTLLLNKGSETSAPFASPTEN